LTNAAETSDTQDALLEKARAGDFDALAALCEPCRRQVCVYLCGSGLAGEDDAEDVFMDAVLRARRAIGSFHGGASFSTWLVTIARNLALDRRRSAATHPLLSLDAPPALDNDGTPPEPRLSSDESFPNPLAAPDPSSGLDAPARAALVRAALATIPGKTREALVLFYMQNLSYQQISEVLSIPIGTVMSRLHNGRRLLEKALRPHLEDLS